MPIKIDVDFIFDGNTPREVNEAIRFVNSKQFKPSFKYRKEILDLQLISDFFSGKGNVPELGLEGFLGFIGEPSQAEAKKRGYENPRSLPDIEADSETIKELVGPQIAAEMEAASAATGVTGLGVGENVTAELKQTMSLNKRKESITGRVVKDGDLDKINKVIRSSSNKYGDEAKLIDWLFDNASKAYREGLFKQFDQKFANFIHVAYVDDKGPLEFPKAYVVAGAAKKLNIRNRARAKQFLAPEFRKGSLALRLNVAGQNFLEEHGTDITRKLFERMSDNFGNKMLKFLFTKNGTRRAVREFPKIQSFISKGKKVETPFTTRMNENQSIIIFLAELIYFASTFDEKMGGKPFNIRSAQNSDVRNFGALTSAVKVKESKARQGAKQQLASEIQLTSLVQQAMQQRMAKGVPGGPPEPTPGRLTFRTGRYVKSVNITRITSKKLIYFKYDPIYRQWESEYNAETFISQTIREVAQREFGKRFFVYREKRI